MADTEITSVIDKEKAANASNGDPNNTLTTDVHLPGSANWPTSMKELVDPKGPFIRKWNVIFIASCVCAVLLDPLFLYIPIINEDMKCLRLDNNLKIAALLLRSLTDICYLLNIFLEVYSCKNCSAVRSGSCSNNTTIEPGIAKAQSYILIDILAVLPLPQVVILNFFCKTKGSGSFGTRKLMNFLVLVQYVPRVFRIYLSCQEFKNSSKEETPIWLKGLLNFFLYILASHILGAFWYFFAVQRVIACWQYGCRVENGCDPNNLDCRDHHALRNIAFLDDACSIHPANEKLFDFGIYLNIIQLGILGSTSYPEKLSNCFWWGLRNLSSLGSNLQTSINTWENLFAASISIIGLLLFIYLIGNLQLETSRREAHRWKMKIQKKMEEKREAVERWLSNNGIPLRRKSDIMEKIQVEFEEKRDVDTEKSENIFSILPSALQKEMRSCMPFYRVKNCINSLISKNTHTLPSLQSIDDKVLKAISGHLKPEMYNKNDIIIREDEPLEKMIFIVDGSVIVEMRDWHCTLELSAGKVYGEKLLTWPAWTSSPGKSNESVRAITKTVEVLVLTATDMETIGMETIGSKFKAYLGRRNTPLKEANWELLTSDLVTSLRHVPIFQRMDSQVLKEISRNLKRFNYSNDAYIIREGDPLDKMFFLVDGSSLSIESSRPSTRKSLCIGEFYGEELVHWVIYWSSQSQTTFPANVPLSTGSVKVPANTGIVEVRVLPVHELKNIVSLFMTQFKQQFMKQLNLPMDIQDKKLSTFDPLITWLRQVPNLQNMDEGGLKAFCEEFKLMKYNDKSRDIITTGENKFDKMFLIVSGLVCIRKIKCDDHFCYSGQHYGDHELFEWVSRTSPTDYTLPKSDVTVEAVGDVEALVLMADDLVTLASKFKLQSDKVVNDPDRKHPGKKPILKALDLEALEKKLRRSTRNSEYMDVDQCQVVDEESLVPHKILVPYKTKARVSKKRTPWHPIYSSIATDEVFEEEASESKKNSKLTRKSRPPKSGATTSGLLFEAETVDADEQEPQVDFEAAEQNVEEEWNEASEEEDSDKKLRPARQQPSVLKEILRAAVVLDFEEESVDYQEIELDARELREPDPRSGELSGLQEFDWDHDDTSIIHTYGKQMKSSKVSRRRCSKKRASGRSGVRAGKPSHLMHVLNVAYTMDLDGGAFDENDEEPVSDGGAFDEDEVHVL